MLHKTAIKLTSNTYKELYNLNKELLLNQENFFPWKLHNASKIKEFQKNFAKKILFFYQIILLFFHTEKLCKNIPNNAQKKY